MRSLLSTSTTSVLHGQQQQPCMYSIRNKNTLRSCCTTYAHIGPIPSMHAPQLTRIPLRACAPEHDQHAREADLQQGSSVQQPTLVVPTLSIRHAAGHADLRASATLKASCFYTYPPERNPAVAANNRRMNARMEWDSLTARVEGRDPAYKDVKVMCMLATIEENPQAPGAQLLSKVCAGMDLSSKIPPDGVTSHLPAVLVATLDVNIGAALPAEQLQGRLPAEDEQQQQQQQQQQRQQRRAYLSNVCVAHAARRLGIARSLLLGTEAEVRKLGVQHLYVHVAQSNASAIALYKGLGFELESEETDECARAMKRPRRLLLHKQL